jgi:hypothetical protein
MLLTLSPLIKPSGIVDFVGDTCKLNCPKLPFFILHHFAIELVLIYLNGLFKFNPRFFLGAAAWLVAMGNVQTSASKSNEGFHRNCFGAGTPVTSLPNNFTRWQNISMFKVKLSFFLQKPLQN